MDIFAVSALTHFLIIETEIFQINFPFIIEHRKGFPGAALYLVPLYPQL